MWIIDKQQKNNNDSHYRILENGHLMSVRQFFLALRDSQRFREFYSSQLCEQAMDACFWELAPFTLASIDQPLAYAVIGAPSLAQSRADDTAFANPFSASDSTQPVAVFENLGADALLVAPKRSPRADNDSILTAYTHLLSFLRSASPTQIEVFWQRIAGVILMYVEYWQRGKPPLPDEFAGDKQGLFDRSVVASLRALFPQDNSPVWISTSGLGVPWLHVRLDRYPKYYQHRPFTTLAVNRS